MFHLAVLYLFKKGVIADNPAFLLEEAKVLSTEFINLIPHLFHFFIHILDECLAIESVGKEVTIGGGY